MLPRSDGFLPYRIIPIPGGMLIEKDVMVTMRDGVRLASNVYRPDKPGKFPVILAMTPYGKDQTPPIDKRRIRFLSSGLVFSFCRSRLFAGRRCRPYEDIRAH